MVYFFTKLDGEYASLWYYYFDCQWICAIFCGIGNIEWFRKLFILLLTLLSFVFQTHIVCIVSVNAAIKFWEVYFFIASCFCMFLRLTQLLTLLLGGSSFWLTWRWTALNRARTCIFWAWWTCCSCLLSWWSYSNT